MCKKSERCGYHWPHILIFLLLFMIILDIINMKHNFVSSMLKILVYESLQIIDMKSEMGN